MIENGRRDTGAGGKFLGVRRNFARILPNLPEKYVTYKKKLFFSIQARCEKAVHVNSGAITFKSKHVGRHFCSDFLGVLDGS